MRDLESHQPIKKKEDHEIDFKFILGYSLLRLVGNHEQLKSALEQLHLIIIEESLVEENKDSKPSTPQDISDRCQQLINTLKKNKELNDRGFEELDQQILHPMLYYANLPKQSAIPRSQFLAIIHQNLNDIFLEIQNGFRFQDEKSDQEEIKKATKTVQERQKQKESEHNQFFVRLLNPFSQSTIMFFELGFVAAVDIALNWIIPSSRIYHLIQFGSFVVVGGIEMGNFLSNRRSLLTNLLYTLPSALISRLRRNTADQNEQAPLLNNARINRDAPINNNSYGSMNAQLVQAVQTAIVVTEVLPEVTSPATLDDDSIIREAQPQNRSVPVQQNDDQALSKSFEL